MSAAVVVLQGHGLRVTRVGPARVAWVAWAGRCVFEAQVAGHAVVMKADEAAARSAREAAVLRTAYAAGIPVPEVLAHVSGAVSALVLRRLSGAALGATAHPGAWRSARSWLRRLHAVAPAPAVTTATRPGQSVRDHLLEATRTETRRAEDGGLLGPGHCRSIRTLLERAWQGMDEPALCLVHGDAQPEHFLIDADARVTRLLDFSDAHRGDPVYDLAVLTLEHPDLLTAVLEGYRTAAALRARIDALISPTGCCAGSARPTGCTRPAWTRALTFSRSREPRAARDLRISRADTARTSQHQHASIFESAGPGPGRHRVELR